VRVINRIPTRTTFRENDSQGRPTPDVNIHQKAKEGASGGSVPSKFSIAVLWQRSMVMRL